MSRLKIVFQYDKRRGEVTEFLVDDGDRTAPEEHHIALGRKIADQIVPRALVRDAGELVIAEPETVREPAQERRRERRGQGNGEGES